MVETVDTPDMVLMISNINDQINLFMFLFQFLMAVAYVFFLVYTIYKIIDWFVQ